MADPVDISGMPDPATVGLAPDDPTNGMPDPATIYQQHRGFAPQSPEELAEFMRDPDAFPDVRKAKSARYGASMLTGLPRIAAVANPVTMGAAAIAGGAGALTGALGAVAHTALGEPEKAEADLATGSQRLSDWSGNIYKLAEYATPTTGPGGELAAGVLNVPTMAAQSLEPALNATIGENATQTLGETASKIATVLPAVGAPAIIRSAIKSAKGAYRAVNGAPSEAPAGTTYDAAGNAVPPPTAIAPPVGQPVTGDTLRAQPNPIPPPDGTVAAAKAKPKVPPRMATANPAPETHTEAPAPTAAPPSQPITQEPGAPATPPAAAGTPSPGGAQRGSVRLFNSPKEEGPQETPQPEEQAAREQSINDLDKLSGGGLPVRRQSAVSGDYNATGKDWQDKETGSKTMQAQVASENAALHTATDNVHNSVGSLSDDSVDPTTLGDRGRVVRGAIQGIEKHFDDATDGIYDTARASSGGRPMQNFLGRATDFLNDKANYMPEGFRASALERLNQLKTVGDKGIVGDGSDAAAPSSVGAAEKFRQWLNANRTLDNMHTTKQLVDHTDMDVAENGGPGLFKAARNMKRHAYQMLEEPTGIKKLLAPSDSQGINHAIPEHKVMDYIADLPREQHEHVMDVLRSGAHLGDGELAESSAAAIREIQGHTISRLHDAAMDDGGKWNARGFYNAASRYARNAASTFKDRPDVIKNLQTINDAGNALHMDKHYPGAVGQEMKATGLGRAIEAGGRVAASIAHEIPLGGRLVGRAIEHGVEGVGGQLSEAAREKAISSRLVDRNGKQRGAVGDLTQPPPGPLGAMMGNKQRGALGDLNQRDAIQHQSRPDGNEEGTITHRYTVPNAGGSMNVVERPGLGVTQGMTSNVINKGQGWGTRMLQRAVDDAHARGQVWHSDDNVSEGQAGTYKNLAQLGYKVTKRDADLRGGAYQAVGDHVFEVRPRPTGGKVNVPNSQRGSVRVMNEAPPEESNGSMLNVGLHQGTEGQPGFRKMSKQEAQAAVESTGAKVTKNTVLTPEKHGVAEPTAVMSTDRPLSHEEMQSVLAKTKQSAIPQRTDRGDESMHVAPGHEQVAKEQGWDSYNPDYFREHDGRTATETMANPKNIHPDTTVTNSQRSWKGIYDDPKEIMNRLGPGQPESPHLKEIFGKTRKDLHDDAIARGDVEPKTPIPGITQKGKGSAHAVNVANDANAERIRNIISAYKDHDLSGYHGMVGWYEMDPMLHSIRDILGNETSFKDHPDLDGLAGKVYHRLNSHTSYSSPMSGVGPEIVRGTASATLAAEGKFGKYPEYGGNPTSKTALKRAPELNPKNFELGNQGHMAHGSQWPAISRFEETGQEADAVKTGTYRRSSDAPSREGNDHQNTVPVGDSHWARGVGLADVRKAKAYDGSAEGPEMKVLGKWYHDNVARHPDIDIPSTSAQAVQWAALSKETGVDTRVGAPKLELFADKIAEAAKREGVPPKELWRRIIVRLASGAK